MFSWRPEWWLKLFAPKDDLLQQTVADIKISIQNVQNMMWGEFLSLIVVVTVVVYYFYNYTPHRFDFSMVVWGLSFTVLVIAKFFSLRRLNKKLRPIYTYFNVR